MRYWELGLQHHILLLLLHNSTHNKGEIEENAQGMEVQRLGSQGSKPFGGNGQAEEGLPYPAHGFQSHHGCFCPSQLEGRKGTEEDT